MPLWFWLILTLLIACIFCWFISPHTNIKIKKLQKIVALTWILFRRIVSFAVVIFGMLCIYILWKGTGSITNKIFGTAMLLCISGFFIYVGILGQGWNQYGIRDDLSLYKKTKQKYGTRW